jgi:hypothetical protein
VRIARDELRRIREPAKSIDALERELGVLVAGLLVDRDRLAWGFQAIRTLCNPQSKSLRFFAGVPSHGLGESISAAPAFRIQALAILVAEGQVGRDSQRPCGPSRRLPQPAILSQRDRCELVCTRPLAVVLATQR